MVPWVKKARRSRAGGAGKNGYAIDSEHEKRRKKGGAACVQAFAFTPKNKSGGVKPLLHEDKSKKLFEAADLQGGVLVWAGESGEAGLLKDDPVDAVELLEMEKVGAGQVAPVFFGVHLFLPRLG